MCGLVGVAGKLGLIDEGLMKRLLILDFFRGTDSTGLASVRKEGEVLISKMATHPINLFDTTSFAKTLNGYVSKAFIGHNRAATLGKVNDVNAHPFQYGHIVGAHNGTLDRDSWTRLEEAAGQTTTVDSAAIFASIEKVGIEKTVSLMEEGKTSKDGAWALVWVNTQDNTLNMLRNKHRPLWIAYAKDYSKVLWASEWPMIEAAARLSATEYPIAVDAEGYGFWEIPADVWYKFDLTKLSEGSETCFKPVTKKLKGREPVPTVSYAGNVAPFQRPLASTTGSTTSYPGASKLNGSSTPEFLEFSASKKNPYAGIVSQDEFETITAHGCSWCHDPVKYEDVGVIVNLEHDYVLCSQCHNTGYHQNRVYVSTSEFAKLNEEVFVA